jgi:predicted nucleic acid-binding protein
MNTLNFLDANVWLALLWSRHVHSERARFWFEQAGQEQFLFGRFTQITVLGLLTTERIMGVDTKSMAEAWSLWDRIWADDRVVFVPEPENIEKEFRARLSNAQSLSKGLGRRLRVGFHRRGRLEVDHV